MAVCRFNERPLFPLTKGVRLTRIMARFWVSDEFGQET